MGCQPPWPWRSSWSSHRAFGSPMPLERPSPGGAPPALLPACTHGRTHDPRGRRGPRGRPSAQGASRTDGAPPGCGRGRWSVSTCPCGYPRRVPFSASFDAERGLLLASRRRGASTVTVAWSDLLSAQRSGGRPGFTLHLVVGDPVRIRMPRRAMREFEQRLRDAGVRLVDYLGATIDESQYAKEADPDFVKRSVAEYRSGVGQWSDDG